MVTVTVEIFYVAMRNISVNGISRGDGTFQGKLEEDTVADETQCS